ncbi:MAG: hypothetical protein A3C58_00980 [Candidatus Staskawiczbacteria bacterium RIFCSPHIGHO2_02_FULL_34_10]|uniref:Uncharacterized protein n=1 Tax=Candidatus Staskawiczbacteria bacterium RIFCSPHIGHO2_02_FULL_34_10 TaxID=1802205 RepID=A0A1G2HYL2_9BACT|nr:MAG: hypothetical protein A3C58_00980 [Candidatus Staskawiczbacteria bacterium RIFCSPHIGHO2_02_FULL_34_10]
MEIEQIAQFMQLLIYGAILIGLGLNLYIVKKIGKGIMNVVFISFGMSLFLIGLSNVFVALYESSLEDITLHIFWHIIAYLGFLSLIWGGYRIKKIIGSPNPQGFGVKDVIVFGAMLNITILVFIFAPILNEGLFGILAGSAWEQLGIHHLIAFLLGVIGALYLFYIKGGPQAGKSITFIGVFLLLLGVQHFWEIINETFHLFAISGSTVELIEQFIIFPAILFFIAGQKSIINFIKGTK